MDIIDIVLAKAMSPEGQIETSLNKIQAATSQANKAVADANSAVKKAEEILAQLDETAPTAINFETVNNDQVVVKTISTDDDSLSFKAYKSIGNNEDGTMTQKAIKIYVDSKAFSGESGSTNLGDDNNGAIVVVGEDGTLTPGTITESSIIRTQILTGTFQAVEALGLEIDYDNKTISRVQDSINYNMGEDFNKYSIYGGINRCLVDDDGAIISFYGDDIYIDNFSTGYQTMVYIPKFYYMRVPIKISNNVIKKEIIMVSGVEQRGFKLHPVFINEDKEEVDYFLYPAYEGSTFDVSANSYNRNDGEIDFSVDKLSSVTNAKPMSGVNNELTIDKAEQLAQNRGEDWHITSFKAESAIQMLAAIEFGSLNGQAALEAGVSTIPNSITANCASYTGSTAELGNKTGHATETINERDGNEYTLSNVGGRAISYRGIEDLWGNIWRLISGIKVLGNGEQRGGIPYIYDGGEYKSIGFSLPNTSNWISNFGYSSEDFDWAFIPVATENANSAAPVGDFVWVEPDLDGETVTVLGGNWAHNENDGLFYYGFDKSPLYVSRTYSARVMFVPKKNSIYEENVAAWKASIGG